ncbi:PREDICTED: uncharacterized protein LOC107328244 [Acropora digitifera]|uniref:uncharacterized protein LOC107328244 n=1 Tax=Acropora digitifera TaxID=70779 RepID=UPI00077AE9D5|nr:PREDICTED: uncharacterized protein LOC107328244 [Acropora digitifera]XP_029205064.1 uncharacterized protein LOC114968974 [Acropora millepora]
MINFGYLFLFMLVSNVHPIPFFKKSKQAKDSNFAVSCVNVIFINEYKKPIRIWKTMSKRSFKGFAVPGKIYKLKTMATNRKKPIVFHAEALADKSRQLLLEGQESISILPFDCDETFINVTVTDAGPTERTACQLLSQGGNSDGLCCHFPFTYKNTSYNSCINKDREALWCATTKNFDKERKWGFC